MNDKMPEVTYLNDNDTLVVESSRGTKYIRSDLYDRRVTELLEANNRLVEENRRLRNDPKNPAP